MDTNNWNVEFGNKAYLEPMAQLYHHHPAYLGYPVVNITKEAALLYCEWLTTKLNTHLTEENFKVEVSLPTRNEWLRAANGDHRYPMYSWGGPYLRNDKGCFLSNFNSIGDESIHYNTESGEYEIKPMAGRGNTYLKDNAFFTAHVSSYFPNDYGIYNLNGNVAEMVQEGVACGGSWKSSGYDIRNASTTPINHVSTTIGFRPIFRIVKD